MVKSMFAAIAGLKAHQTKMDVLSNNIANVNTWGYKSKTTNFSDAMYQNVQSGGKGDVTTGSTGGKNASQLGFGANVSSIVTDYTTGSWNPTGNGWNCMINGPSFFIVGPMSAGNIEFNGFAQSGMSLSRVGIFEIDSNGYLVNDTGNYVYGFELQPGTGTPEIPATKETISVENTKVEISAPNGGLVTVTIGGVEVKGISENLSTEDKIKEWANKAPYFYDKTQNPDADQIISAETFAGYTIAFNGFEEVQDGGDTVVKANLTFRAKTAGVITDGTPDGEPKPLLNDLDTIFGTTDDGVVFTTEKGTNRIPAKEAKYNDLLSPIRLPQNVDAFNSFTIGTDGTIVGIDENSRPHTIGKIAVATVANPNGLEQTEGYLYNIGPNAGKVSIQPAGSDAVGKILSGYLEMSNVDLATEMSTMITAQRGYQANTKIISVTDQMLEELVNIKR